VEYAHSAARTEFLNAMKVTLEYLGLRGARRKQQNKELIELYSKLSIVQVTKSRRIRWAGHVARMGGDKRCIQGFGANTRGKETTWKTQA
jgi:hypothetical protein